MSRRSVKSRNSSFASAWAVLATSVRWRRMMVSDHLGHVGQLPAPGDEVPARELLLTADPEPLVEAADREQHLAAITTAHATKEISGDRGGRRRARSTRRP
jgi:hypothetical protein